MKRSREASASGRRRRVEPLEPRDMLSASTGLAAWDLDHDALTLHSSGLESDHYAIVDRLVADAADTLSPVTGHGAVVLNSAGNLLALSPSFSFTTDAVGDAVGGVVSFEDRYRVADAVFDRLSADPATSFTGSIGAGIELVVPAGTTDSAWPESSGWAPTIVSPRDTPQSNVEDRPIAEQTAAYVAGLVAPAPLASLVRVADAESPLLGPAEFEIDRLYQVEVFGDELPGAEQKSAVLAKGQTTDGSLFAAIGVYRDHYESHAGLQHLDLEYGDGLVPLSPEDDGYARLGVTDHWNSDSGSTESDRSVLASDFAILTDTPESGFAASDAVSNAESIDVAATPVEPRLVDDLSTNSVVVASSPTGVIDTVVEDAAPAFVLATDTVSAVARLELRIAASESNDASERADEPENERPAEAQDAAFSELVSEPTLAEAEPSGLIDLGRLLDAPEPEPLVAAVVPSAGDRLAREVAFALEPWARTARLSPAEAGRTLGGAPTSVEDAARRVDGRPADGVREPVSEDDATARRQAAAFGWLRAGSGAAGGVLALLAGLPGMVAMGRKRNATRDSDGGLRGYRPPNRGR
ncbi:MAG: hypothetical protein AAFV43_12685 [Planctomycetota bacterium]